MTSEDKFIFKFYEDVATLVSEFNSECGEQKYNTFARHINNLFLLLSRLEGDISGNVEKYIQFVRYCFPKAKRSYCDNFLDFVIPYLSGELRCARFIEVGDGIPLYGSLTAILEAEYGWSGILVESLYDNIDGLAECRSADVVKFFDFIELPQKYISTQGKLASIPNDADHTSNTDYCVDFLAISGVNVVEILESVDIKNTLIKYVYILSSVDWCEKYNVYMSQFGYKVFVPEFFSDGKLISLFFYRDDVSLSCQVFESDLVFRSQRTPRRLDMLSCHFPKTGGVSLMEGLKRHYGDSLYESYFNIPGMSKHNIDRCLTVGKKVQAVHGHFNVHSYINLNPRMIITFIRDPLELLLSFYRYMKSTGYFSIHWGFDLPSLEGVLHAGYAPYKVYFGNVDPTVFDFIGQVETFDVSLQKLSQLSGIEFPVVHFNQTCSSVDMTLDDSRKNSLKSMLASEYVVYERLRKLAV